jgi:sec-independent protein translocase protein TatC
MRHLSALTWHRWIDDIGQALARPFWLRMRICLGALVVGLLLAIEPVPWAPETSLSALVIASLVAPASIHLVFLRSGQGFAVDFHVAVLLSLAIAQPTIVWLIFETLTPLSTPSRHWRIHLVVLVMVAAFFVGIATAYAVLLPIVIQSLLVFGTTGPGLETMWAFSEYIPTTATMIVVFGAICELPALTVGSVWLRIVERERLAKWRPYAILTAFIVGAWVTPTPDIINQAIVAIPICLFYELGLLLARLVPPECSEPAKP